MAAYLGQRFGTFVAHRVLDHERPVELDLLRERDRPLGVVAAVALEDQVDVGADGLADRGGVLDLLPHGERVLVQSLRVVVVKPAVSDSRDAPARPLLGLRDHLSDRLARDVTVQPDLVAREASEQLVDRNAQLFALEVPERHVDPGEGRAGSDPAPVEAAAVTHLPDVFDPVCILPDQVRLEVLEQAVRSLRRKMIGRLAVAYQAILGFDRDEAGRPAVAGSEIRAHVPDPGHTVLPCCLF